MPYATSGYESLTTYRLPARKSAAETRFAYAATANAALPARRPRRVYEDRAEQQVDADATTKSHEPTRAVRAAVAAPERDAARAGAARAAAAPRARGAALEVAEADGRAHAELGPRARPHGLSRESFEVVAADERAYHRGHLGHLARLDARERRLVAVAQRAVGGGESAAAPPAAKRLTTAPEPASSREPAAVDPPISNAKTSPHGSGTHRPQRVEHAPGRGRRSSSGTARG